MARPRYPIVGADESTASLLVARRFNRRATPGRTVRYLYGAVAAGHAGGDIGAVKAIMFRASTGFARTILVPVGIADSALFSATHVAQIVRDAEAETTSHTVNAASGQEGNAATLAAQGVVAPVKPRRTMEKLWDAILAATDETPVSDVVMIFDPAESEIRLYAEATLNESAITANKLADVVQEAPPGNLVVPSLW
jgi:hypothetical protein